MQYNQKPILLLEDDRVDAMTVERALKELGITNPLVHTSDGEEALRYLQDPTQEKPSLILMDLNTPKMNGLEFLEIIKADEQLSQIPVVVMSTSDEERDRQQANRLGVCDYIVKCVDYKEFVNALSRISRYCSTETAGQGVQP